VKSELLDLGLYLLMERSLAADATVSTWPPHVTSSR